MAFTEEELARMQQATKYFETISPPFEAVDNDVLCSLIASELHSLGVATPALVNAGMELVCRALDAFQGVHETTVQSAGWLETLVMSAREYAAKKEGINL